MRLVFLPLLGVSFGSSIETGGSKGGEFRREDLRGVRVWV